MRLDPSMEGFLAPVHDVIVAAAARLGCDGDVAVRWGAIDGFHAWSDGIVLSERLGGAVERHPLDEGPHGLDRWRRATASVLEGMVGAGLPPGGPEWLRLGLAIWRVHVAEPSLGLLDRELVGAARGDLLTHPRGGAAVLAAWDHAGHDADAMALTALTSGRVEVKDWIDAGRWILGAGTSALAGRVLPDPVDVPAQLSPWTWAPVEVAPSARGGHVRVRGSGGIVPAWAPSGMVFRALAGATARGCQLDPEPGGPLGSWELRSSRGWGQVMGARGVQFTFHASGRVEVLLADAFVGSVAAIDASKEVGTSGMVRGTWFVSGPRRLGLRALQSLGVTVHGRSDAPFAVPGEGSGLVAGLQSMADSPWSWRMVDGQLELTGQLMGTDVVILLSPTPSTLDA